MKEHPELPAKLRVEMWLGLEKQQQYWTARPKTEGDFCVFAETVSSRESVLWDRELPYSIISVAGATINLRSCKIKSHEF